MTKEEKNGVISTSLMGLLLTVVAGCFIGWVSWVYANIGELQGRAGTNLSNISALQECSKNLLSGQQRIEQKVDKLLDMHLNK